MSSWIFFFSKTGPGLLGRFYFAAAIAAVATIAITHDPVIACTPHAIPTAIMIANKYLIPISTLSLILFPPHYTTSISLDSEVSRENF